MFLSFIEAIIFPIMPEVMLVPMCVAKPRRAFWFATLSLAGSMVGALVGYFLGHYAFEALKPMFAAIGMLHGIDGRLGKEVWAFIPFNLLPKLTALSLMTISAVTVVPMPCWAGLSRAAR